MVASRRIQSPHISDHRHKGRVLAQLGGIGRWVLEHACRFYGLFQQVFPRINVVKAANLICAPKLHLPHGQADNIGSLSRIDKRTRNGQ